VNFRESVVGGLGFCGLDRRREALSGEEQRACWAGAFAAPTDSIFAAQSESSETALIDVQPARGALRPVSGR